MVWPIDYPCRVVQPYQPLPLAYAPNSLQVALTRGLIGRVVNDDPYNNICIQLPIDAKGNPGAQGWIPKSIVQISGTRSLTDGYILDVNAPRAPGLSNAIFYDNRSLLWTTISGLLSSYHQHRQDYPIQPQYLETELSSPTKVQIWTERLVQGMGRVSESLRKHFETGNFTVHDVEKSSTALHRGSTDHRTGIYMIVTHDHDGTVRVYVGSTGQSFMLRYSNGYLSELRSSSRRKVILAIRNAKSWRMVPICILTIADPSDVKIAEQIFVDLCQTYSSDTLSFVRVEDFESDTHTSSDNQLSTVAKNIIRKEQCYVMESIARKVFKKTGWPGCVRRDRNGTWQVPKGRVRDFGSRIGLNAQAPISEMSFVKTPWVMTKGPGFKNFRRTQACLTPVDNMMWALGLHHSGGGGTGFWIAHLPQASPYPPLGTYVHVVFEVLDSDSGRISDVPMAQLPAVGPFSDWTDASRLALRFEWRNEATGRWEGAYWQMNKQLPPLEGSPEFGGTNNYNIAIGIRNFLLQQSRSLSTDFEWLWDFGTARVKEVYLDNFDLKIHVRDARNHAIVPGPTKSTAEEVGQRLTAPPFNLRRFAKPSDKFYPFFHTGQDRDGSRTACDGCQVHAAQQPGGVSHCVMHDTQKNVCVRCYRYGRPCTFTPTAELMTGDEYSRHRRALIAPRKQTLFFQGRQGDEMLFV